MPDFAEFDTSELADCAHVLEEVAKNYPKKAQQLMRKLGNIGRRNLRAQTRASVNRKTGNLLKGIDRGRPYLYQGDTWEVRVRNKAPHAHLIEHGHDVLPRKKKPSKGKTRAEAFHPASKAITKTRDEIYNGRDVEDFVDALLEEGFD